MSQLILNEIYIYPIKSLGGIRLDKANVRAKGLQSDRRWMLINDEGVALTQRTYARMALFKVSMESDRIRVDYTQDNNIISSVAFEPGYAAGPPVRATVWNDTVEVIEMESSLSEWFSHHLKVPCRLVAFPEQNSRPVDPAYSVRDEQVSLADAFPFLIIGQSTLDDLNARLDQQLPINRFRPNFVFTGAHPYAEDDWTDLSIGGIRFKAVKKCARCTLTTIDQNTAAKGSEPLKTLSEYRKRGNNIYLGQYLVGLNEGELVTGDAVIPG